MRDRRLAGQDAGPGRDAGPERADGVDELERGPDGPLGVVLVGDRRTPDGHHRVADELLDEPAVPADHLPRELEVAGQELAGVLGVAALGQGREADEVGEQDRHEAALGDRSRGRHPRWPARRPGRRRGGRKDRALEGDGAFAAELRGGQVGRSA